MVTLDSIKRTLVKDEVSFYSDEPSCFYYSDTSVRFQLDLVYFTQADGKLLYRTYTNGVDLYNENAVICKNKVLDLDCEIDCYIDDKFADKTYSLQSHAIMCEIDEKGTMRMNDESRTQIILALCRVSHYDDADTNDYKPNFVLLSLSPLTNKVVFLTEFKYSSRELYLQDIDLAFSRIEGYRHRGTVSYVDLSDRKEVPMLGDSGYWQAKQGVPSDSVVLKLGPSMKEHSELCTDMRIRYIAPEEYDLLRNYSYNVVTLNCPNATVVCNAFLGSKLSFVNCCIHTLILPMNGLSSFSSVKISNCEVDEVIIGCKHANYPIEISSSRVSRIKIADSSGSVSPFFSGREIKLQITNKQDTSMDVNIGSIEKLTLAFGAYCDDILGTIYLAGEVTELSFDDMTIFGRPDSPIWNFQALSYVYLSGNLELERGFDDFSGIDSIAVGLFAHNTIDNDVLNLHIRGSLNISLSDIPAACLGNVITVDVKDCSPSFEFGLYKTYLSSTYCSDEENIDLLLTGEPQIPFENIKLTTSESISLDLGKLNLRGCNLDWVLYKGTSDVSSASDLKLCTFCMLKPVELEKLRLYLSGSLDSCLDLSNIRCNDFELLLKPSEVGSYNTGSYVDVGSYAEFKAPRAKSMRIDISALVFATYVQFPYTPDRFTAFCSTDFSTNKSYFVTNMMLQHRLRAIYASEGIIYELRPLINETIDALLSKKGTTDNRVLHPICYMDNSCVTNDEMSRLVWKDESRVPYDFWSY